MNAILTSFSDFFASFTWLAAFFDDDSGGGAIALLILAGPLFYGVMYARYRNTDKRHFHESETPSALSNLRGYDNFVRHLKRQNNKTLANANNTKVHGSITGNNITMGKGSENFTSKVTDQVIKKR